MSNSKQSSEIDGIKVRKTPLKMTAPGYEVVLSEAQVQELIQTMSTPGWKVLQNVFVAQRKDNIARMTLNSADNFERVRYFQGMAAELALFFQTTKMLKKEFLKEEEKSAEETEEN